MTTTIKALIIVWLIALTFHQIFFVSTMQERISGMQHIISLQTEAIMQLATH